VETNRGPARNHLDHDRPTKAADDPLRRW
jgi:hypothetical protein